MTLKLMGLGTAVMAIATGGVFNIGMGFLVALLGSLAIGYLLYESESKVYVPETEVAVVFKKNGKQFARFLAPGTHWLTPIKESILETIPTTSQTARGVCEGAQTIGGFTLKIEWAAHYGLKPLRLPPAVQAKMARVLPTKAHLVATQHINNVIHHIIGDCNIEQLCEQGAHRKLERLVRQQTRARLEKLGFDVTRVMIGSINMPKHVVEAIEAAHEREIQAEQEARALERLHKVVSQFSDADMQRLMELERIHAMSRNGVAMLYPAMAEAPRRMLQN